MKFSKCEIHIYHLRKLWYNMFQNRKNLGSISWVVKINKKWWMKNTEAVIRTFPQWCNLTLASRSWATKVCLQASKVSKICLFGYPTGRANSWKANFEICSRYSLIKWYQFLSIWYSYWYYNKIQLIISI